MALKRGTGGSIEGGLAGESSDINAKFENRVQQVEYDIGVLSAGNAPTENILVTTLAGPHTIGETISDVCQSFAGAMVYVAPAAIAGRKFGVLKDTLNVGTITVQPAGTDTIHGSTNDYVLDDSDYVSSATTFRRAWTFSCYVTGEWKVS